MLAAPGGGGGAFDGISAAVSGIVEASDSGFMVSENGGQPLLDAIAELQAEVASALSKTNAIGRELPLGTTPNATIYRPFLATVATDPVQGAMPVLQKLHADLSAAATAIRKAMKNYHDADQNAASDLNISGTLT